MHTHTLIYIEGHFFDGKKKEKKQGGVGEGPSSICIVCSYPCKKYFYGEMGKEEKAFI